MDQVWTIKRILEWTTSYFQGLGLERPRLETEALLASSLGVDRLWLYTHYDKPLVGPELVAFRQAVIRRSRREPLQYIIGQWDFWSLEFAVSPNVLIPRQETEHLVEFTLKIAKSADWILDLCTGCGNIAISLAKEMPSASFWATDITPEALKIAVRNAKTHHVLDRICFLMGDLFAPIKKQKVRFDIILCNPPYIPTQKIDKLQPEVKDFEPRLALDGGADGLNFYRRLVPEAIGFLKPSGYLIMEIGSDQAQAVQGMLYHQGYQDVEIIKDYAGLDRVIAGKYLQNVLFRMIAQGEINWRGWL